MGASEEGREDSRLVCFVGVELAWVESGEPDWMASRVEGVMRMLWVFWTSWVKGREPAARCFAKRGETPES